MADITNKPENTPGGWQQQVDALLDKRQWDGAIPLLSAVIPTLKTDAEKARAYFLRGFAYNGKGEYDHAIVDFNRAIELSPNNATAYYNRGAIYNNKREYDLAIVDFNRAIELEPDYASAYNNRGYAYNQKGEHDRAIADFNKAMELEPDDATAYNNRGYAYNQKGEHDRAIADFNKAMELKSDYASAYNNRGGAYSDKKEYDRAVADFNQAIRLKPDYATAYGNRGGVYNLKGEYNRAIADCSRAIELEPKDAAAYNSRGHAYAAKGEHDRALADWEKAIKLAPQQNPAMVDNLLAGIKSATRIRQQLSEKLSTELETAKGFERREKEHKKAQESAGVWVAFLLAVLFVGYLVAFDALWRNKAGGGISEILPWITAIFLTSSPIIWAVRILNREKTRHFALRESAYANRLMTLLLFYKPRDKHAAELVKRFFDHHDFRGSAQLILGATTEKQADDSTTKQVINHIWQNSKQGD